VRVDPVERVYSLLLRLIRPLLPLARSLPPKVADAIEGRRLASSDARAWAERERRPDVPLLWLHAASAGELAGAVPVVRLLRQENPDLQLAITVSSPSGLPLARSLDPEFSGYAPLDTPAESAAMLESLSPDALVFAKLDVWPGLSHAATEADVPLGMINGTVRPDSSRLRSPTRQFLRSTYARLESVGVVGQADADALVILGVDPTRIRITGDAAFDQALATVEAATDSGTAVLPARSAGRVRLLGGSTWPPDEDVLLKAAQQIGSRLDLVLVPHEPSPAALDRIAERCRSIWGRNPILLSELPISPSETEDRAASAGLNHDTRVPLVVDSVGLLAGLYLEADLALVGGAFDATGLHSVIEPAAAGVPVLFGPVHDRREAEDLLARNAALMVTPQDAVDRIRELIDDPDRMKTMGNAARIYAEESGGAAGASARLVSELIELGVSRRCPDSR
jgi:3-deoxy-D-manno-octulosonic-acid transferase